MYQRIKDDIKQAMLKKDEGLTFLRTLKAEIDAIAKNDGNREVEKKDVIKAVSKFTKAAEETISSLKTQNKDFSESEKELEILSSYSPPKLDQALLKSYINEKINEYKDQGKRAIGLIIKDLDKDHPGQDKKLASDLIKSVLV